MSKDVDALDAWSHLLSKQKLARLVEVQLHRIRRLWTVAKYLGSLFYPPGRCVEGGARSVENFAAIDVVQIGAIGSVPVDMHD